MRFSIRSDGKGTLNGGFLLVFLTLLWFPQNGFSALKIISRENVTPRIKLWAGPIISDSDSLFIDLNKLQRDRDYKIDYLNGSVQLTLPDSAAFDSLRIYYSPLPSWLERRYGNAVGQTITSKHAPAISSGGNTYSEISGQKGSELNISGAKRFSFLTQTSGNSQFEQSLELSVKGKLTEGVEVIGSVSDRGYNSEYGTVNSRINELDKVNLTVRSQSFFAEVGNLELIRDSEYRSPILKQVSGLQARYRTDRFSGYGTVARPRGKFETTRFYGSDGTQGPYRVRAGNKIDPVVPNSETVWVNGKQLERGADKDYIMDYPAATIAFTVRVPIDSRSRIEIDFEPLTSDYQKELYRTGGGYSFGDSVFSVSVDFLLEGDNKDRLKSGELSESDISILQAAGDNADGVIRDGAVADTSGDYLERFDGGGNRYFEYIGNGNGDYRVSFSPDDSGSYVYDGGERYRYVGAGEGDYSPIVRIPVPAQERQYNVGLKFNPSSDARFGVKVYGSDYDRNLFSGLDDGDNTGARYVLEAGLGAVPRLYTEKSGISVNADYSGANFKIYNRRSAPDNQRKYLIPDVIDTTVDRNEILSSATGYIGGPVGLLVEGAYLDYRDRFRSLNGKMSLYPSNKCRYLPVLSAGLIESDKDEAGEKSSGTGRVAQLDWNAAINKDASVNLMARYDRRKNEYSGELRGTTEREVRIGGSYDKLSATLERYDEDTLIVSWRDKLVRDRGALQISKNIGNVSTEWYLGVQRQHYGKAREDQLLARLSWSYSAPKKYLTITGRYTISDENRFQRGIRYVEVDPGQGQYIYEDGQYIPDPEGNFIEIEEILSEQAAVQSGEKTFDITWRPKQAYFRGTANVSEELLAPEKRNLFWLIPGYSDRGMSYLQRRRYYAGDLKLWRRGSYFFFNLSGSYNSEIRNVADAENERLEWQGKATFHESFGDWHYLQNGEIFNYRRDQYFNSPGNIDGYTFSLESYYDTFWGQLNGKVGYRYAEDKTGARSKQVVAGVNPVLRYIRNGESSLKIEGYYQELKAEEFISYKLTDNKSGKTGVEWKLRSDYKVSGAVRLSLYLTGRHSDDRKPRFTGRGEMVANF